MKNFFVIGLVGLLLTQVACSQSQVTLTLDLIVTAADTAVSTLQATGQISSTEATLINNYLNEVTSAVQFSTTELASSDTPEVKSAKIIAQFASVAAPQLSGAPAAIVETISAVAKAVANFLSTIQTTSAQMISLKGVESFRSSTHWKLSRGDKSALKKIEAHVKVVKAKIKK